MRASLYAIVVGCTLCSAGCRLLSRDVACYRDLDCPQDAGISFCERPAEEPDAGVGRCVAEDPDPPTDTEDGGPLVTFPDAGEADDAGAAGELPTSDELDNVGDAGFGDEAG